MKEIILLTNGKIYPSATPESLYSSLVIGGGTLLEAGGERLAAEWRDQASEVFDLDGRIVLPGFTDSHIHLEKYAHSLNQIDCETASLEECLDRVAAAASSASPGNWIRGHGWNQNTWGRYGTIAELNTVAPDNPVYLTAKSLHAAWINQEALDRSNFRLDSGSIYGAKIGRDHKGSPNGILYEGAMKLVADHIPDPTRTETYNAIDRAQSVLLRYGITAVHDFDGQSCFAALQELHQHRKLNIRVAKMIQGDQFEAALQLGLRTGFGDDWLHIGHLKLFSDGALGPQTAAMIEPYEFQIDNRGILMLSEQDIIRTGSRASESGIPLAIHAIGDLACRTVVNGYTALKPLIPTPSLPHRIEHLQIMHPSDLESLPGSGLTISMQPLHAPSDRTTADHFLGGRTRYSYAWRSVLETGLLLIFGSDAPVESPNPFLGIYAALTRKLELEDPDEPVWTPEECIDLEHALRAYTVNPPQAVGRGGTQGRLEPGFAADLIVLEKDPYELDDKVIPAIKPSGVMTGGVWRFREF